MVSGLLAMHANYKQHCILGLEKWSQDWVGYKKEEQSGALESGLSTSIISRVVQLYSVLHFGIEPAG